MMLGKVLVVLVVVATTSALQQRQQDSSTYGYRSTTHAVSWPASAEGYTGKVKPFWFGANASGLDSDETLALIAKHTVGG